MKTEMTQIIKFFKVSSVFMLLAIVAVSALLLMPNPANAGGKSGLCGSAHNGDYGTAPTNKAQMCARGSASSASVNGSNRWAWTCSGSNGTNASCSASNCGTAPPPTTVNGVCNNATRNACASGNPNDAVIADTSSEYRWRCDGTGSPVGTNSGTCSKAKPVTVNWGCIIDTTGADSASQNANCAQPSGCTGTHWVEFSVGNSLTPTYDAHIFDDPDYHVSWSGDCNDSNNIRSSTQSWCTIERTGSGTFTSTATVRYPGSSGAVVATRTISANKGVLQTADGSGSCGPAL